MPRSGRVPRPPPAPGASTPAHAGPTQGGSMRMDSSSLYPRARGADTTFLYPVSHGTPLPPRTRGRRPDHGAVVPGPASTPAHAGPAPSPAPGPTGSTLYPRARGAGGLIGRGSGQPRPLPPRTRGRRAAGDGQAGHAASTPAHAGPAAPEPETSSPADPLPPRTRGRRDDPDRSGVQKASTPAHAGPARGRAGSP